MFVKRLSVLLVTAAMAGGLFAAESKPQPPKPGEERPDDVVCTFETPVGSHIKRRICATRQAREEAQKASQETLERTGRTGRNQGGGARGEPSPGL